MEQQGGVLDRVAIACGVQDLSFFFQRNFGVLAHEGQRGESLLLSWGWETATLCPHRILKVFRKFAAIDVLLPSLFIFLNFTINKTFPILSQESQILFLSINPQ